MAFIAWSEIEKSPPFPILCTGALHFQACSHLAFGTQGCDPGNCNGKCTRGDGLGPLLVQGVLEEGEKGLKDRSLPLYFSLSSNEYSYHVLSSGPKEEEKSLNTELRWSWISFNRHGFDCISEQTIKHQLVPKAIALSVVGHRHPKE